MNFCFLLFSWPAFQKFLVSNNVKWITIDVASISHNFCMLNNELFSYILYIGGTIQINDMTNYSVKLFTKIRGSLSKTLETSVSSKCKDLSVDYNSLS